MPPLKPTIKRVNNYEEEITNELASMYCIVCHFLPSLFQELVLLPHQSPVLEPSLSPTSETSFLRNSSSSFQLDPSHQQLCVLKIIPALKKKKILSSVRLQHSTPLLPFRAHHHVKSCLNLQFLVLTSHSLTHTCPPSPSDLFASFAPS